MSIVEVIGFIISIFSLIFLFFKNRRQESENEKREGEKRPEYKQDSFMEEDPLKELIKAMGYKEREVEKKDAWKAPPPLPPKIQSESRQSKKKYGGQREGRQMKSTLEDRHIRSSVENHSVRKPLSSQHEDGPQRVFPSLPREKEPLKSSRARAAFDRLVDKKDMVIFREILDKPKSLKEE